VIDRCNPTPTDRRYWVDLAFRPEDAVCVYFATDRRLCKDRVMVGDARVHVVITQAMPFLSGTH